MLVRLGKTVLAFIMTAFMMAHHGLTMAQSVNPPVVYLQHDGNGNVVGFAAQPQADPSFDKQPTPTIDPAFTTWYKAQQAK